MAAMPPSASFPVGLEHLDSSRPPAGFKRSPNNDYWILEKPIEKSSNDRQDYQMIRLDNGLEATLVSSESIDVAGGSLLCKRLGSSWTPYVHPAPKPRNATLKQVNRLNGPDWRTLMSISCFKDPPNIRKRTNTKMSVGLG